jgi:hypothetical protein
MSSTIQKAGTVTDSVMVKWLISLGTLAVVVVFVSNCSQQVAVAQARADDALARADLLADSLEVQRELTASLQQTIARNDSVYAADSARWVVERADLTNAARDAETASHTALDSLRATLTPPGQALLDKAEAQIEIERQARLQIIQSMTAEIDVLQQRIVERDELIASLHAEIDIHEQRTAELGMANAFLQSALTSRTRQATLLKVAGVALLSLAVYDRVAG